MSIANYREITKERLAAIEKARKAIARVNNLYWSTFGLSALENLQIVKLEVEADLRAHERVAGESAAEKPAPVDSVLVCVNCTNPKEPDGYCINCGKITPSRWAKKEMIT